MVISEDLGEHEWDLEDGGPCGPGADHQEKRSSQPSPCLQTRWLNTQKVTQKGLSSLIMSVTTPGTVYKHLGLEAREGPALTNPHKEAGTERVRAVRRSHSLSAWTLVQSLCPQRPASNRPVHVSHTPDGKELSQWWPTQSNVAKASNPAYRRLSPGQIRGDGNCHPASTCDPLVQLLHSPGNSPVPWVIFFYGHCRVLFILLHFACYFCCWRISNVVNSVLRAPAFQIHRQPAWR